MKILRGLLVLILVLVVIGAAVVWTLPADVALRWFAPPLGPVQISGVSGTIWQGRASNVSVLGQSVGLLDWTLHKAPLLSRRVIADINVAGTMIDAKGELTREADGQLILRESSFRLPAHLLEPALDIPSLKLLGTVEGTMSEARISAGWLAGAKGTARWTQAGVSGQAEARFGDLLAEFASQPDGGIAGTVRDDQRSNLAVEGQFVVRAGQFDASARLSVRNDDSQIREALRYVGEPQADGTSLLKVHGQLFKLL
ncbi:MAG: type II secretion system protein N [Tahibacter sp.]